MKDLIDRQAAIDALDTGLWGVEWDKALATAMLKDLPSAQPEQRKGEWIDVTKTGGAELWKCSECGELELEDSYFCPNCGARMEEE